MSIVSNVIPARRPVLVLLLALLLGVMVNYLIAWACAVWTPMGDPFNSWGDQTNTAYLDLTAPDGKRRFFGVQGSFGTTYYADYGNNEYRLAGLPFRSVWSRVRLWNGNPTAADQTRRWKLSTTEILHRGLGSQDLPASLHSGQDRRLALLPVFPGFIVDTLIYAICVLVLHWMWRVFLRGLRQGPAGFAVIQDPVQPR